MTGSCQQPPGNAVKGCGNVGSRVRVAAAACFVASGLLAGGASVSMAFADSPLTGADSGDKHTDDSGPKSDPSEKKTGSEHSASVGTGKRGDSGTGAGDHKVGSGDHRNVGNGGDDSKVGNSAHRKVANFADEPTPKTKPAPTTMATTT